ESPFEAGLMQAVKLDKRADFIGKAALLQRRSEPMKKKLVTVLVESAADYAWGGEALTIDGMPAGELASVGWSPKVGACVALAYVRGNAATQVHRGTPVEVDLWGVPCRATAWDAWPPKT
ncbi:MAG: glycine cleavage T C-terminal barrel domain-containing protein, partial [Caldimonas sp.]